MMAQTEVYRGYTIEWREGGERHTARVWTPKGDGFDVVEPAIIEFETFQSQARRTIDDLIDGKKTNG
jgi:hypothetical protein